MKAPQEKLVLITRKTRLDDLIARFNTEQQARFYVEHLGADFSEYVDEDRNYKAAVALVQRSLAAVGLVQRVDRGFLPNYQFGRRDRVVVVGQDGLVANTLKYLDGQPVYSVNPDPQRLEGALLTFSPQTVGEAVERSLQAAPACRRITMALVELNTGQRMYAVNDFFIGPKSHGSARYSIEIGRQCERHSSSGIIVSTGLGSTGWFRSVIAGARGIAAEYQWVAEGQPPTLASSDDPAFPWDADYLYFSVREPWRSKTTGADLTFGRITGELPLRVDSEMPERGVIFSDGIEADFLEFNAGTRATVRLADKVGILVG